MEIKFEQRPVPVSSSSEWASRIGLLAIAGVIIIAALAFIFQERASRWFYSAEEAIGLAPSQQQFAGIYRRLGMYTLPSHLFVQGPVLNSLNQLSREACDRRAIFSLANALAANGERRLAASALINFGLSCHGSENEEAAAGQLFLQLGDAERALAIANALTVAKPEIANFHYFRGKALVAAGHGAEAVPEYRSAIDLSPSPRQVREQVFFELADLYAALDRPCDAAQTIVSWIIIDPEKRNTVRAHKLLETYARRGCVIPKQDSRSL